jgi:hypothetical protein
MIKLKFITGIGFVLAVLLLFFPAKSAAKPTPAPLGLVVTSPSPSPSPDITGNSDIRNAIRQEIQQRVNSVATTPTTKSAALVGMITDTSTDKKTLTIATARLGDKIATVASGAAVFRVDSQNQRKTVDFTNAAVGDSIIAIGTPVDNDHLSARRLILYTTPVVKPLVTVGRVVSFDNGHVVVTSVASGQNETFILVQLTRFIRLTKDGGKVTVKPADLPIGTMIIIAGSGLPNQPPTADLITPLTSPLPSPTTLPNGNH